ncbi:GUN4 domain-containing protein [Pseudanabaena sp. FACHB-1277]|uniref:GUN4 domain-containing protein n=1 Tax=Pseudanabaena cinerea FACHB-1277 TaxID=2949581 RepID=A0A926UXW4_9CYAN|nr:GUN4 domain-containing protein [Pseudanabaena cinerea]MBD2151992.1 GUN4 domain-containing protein [Pseudanabaena cinerea FACHB-1277]
MTQTPEPEKSKLTWEEKITDILLKAFMTGGIGVGGANAFWELFAKSDIPKAIASAMIGAGISYGAKMLMPIHKGNEERAEKFGNAINEGMNQAGGAIVAKLTSVEERYFEAQAADCELCRTEGVGKMDNIATPMLEDVFVRLSLNLHMGTAGFRSEQKFAKLVKSEGFDQEVNQEDLEDRFTVDIWELLAKAKKDSTYRQIAILAWGGFGKTTLLRHVTYRLCRNKQNEKYDVQRYVPVLLLLRKYRDLLTQENPDDLPTIIEKHHLPNLNANLQMPPNWARDLLKKGKMMILLDGFDEVPKSQRPLVARWLNTQMRNYPKSVFILSSRPRAYIEQPFDDDRLDLKSVFHVQPFTLKQIQEFVNKWYWCQEYYGCGKTDSLAVRNEATNAARELLEQIANREELTKLASNPLLLTMIARFHRRYPSAELPKRRGDLYQEICNLQLKDRPNARQLETMLTDGGDPQVILQMLALKMMIEKEKRVDREILLERLDAYLSAQNETVNASEFLEDVEKISELLVQKEDELEFSHLSFQEFLAAMEIIRTNQESILHSYFHDDWWKQVILLYVSKVKKPSNLIKTALDAGAIDLALACTQETRKQIDANVKKDLQALEEQRQLQAVEIEIKNSLYQQLEEYLKNQQWYEADQETWKLMLKVTNREEEGYLELDNVRNFPCEDLLTLDRLWVEYSKKHGFEFGFSVQKQIYVECGGTLDFSYPSSETWAKFCDRTAWTNDGKGVDYTDQFFENNFMCVKGHLPSTYNFNLMYGGSLRVWYLFSHQDL